MIEDKVIKRLKEGSWTFQQISNVSTLIEEIASGVYDELDAKAKLDLVWNVEIYDGDYKVPFGQIFAEQVSEELKARIAEIIKIELESAKVNFNKEKDRNEIPKRSMGRKPHKERTPDEKGDSKKQPRISSMG